MSSGLSRNGSLAWWVSEVCYYPLLGPELSVKRGWASRSIGKGCAHGLADASPFGDKARVSEEICLHAEIEAGRILRVRPVR